MNQLILFFKRIIAALLMPGGRRLDADRRKLVGDYQAIPAVALFFVVLKLLE